MPTSGRRIGRSSTDAMTDMFSSVCDATWPITSPVTRAPRAVRARDAVGDPHHQAAVDRRRGAAAGTDSTTCRWISPNATRNSRLRQLVGRQQLRQLAHLLLRGARQERVAVEVDEQHRAAALHHAPRGHRRVDAARQQARHLAAHAGRQPARPALLAEGVERVVGHASRRGSSARGGREVHLPALRQLDPPAHLALDLRRLHREPLVGALDRHAERRRVDVAEVAPGWRRRSPRCRAARARPARSWRSPKTRAQPLAHLLVGRRRARATISMRPISGRTARTSRSEVAWRRFCDEPRDEPGPVLPLERDFLVVDDDEFNRLSA